ncbi:MAG: hypothetical protein MJZ94_00515 [Bacteroidales bacterium]|nr:hypothetical protein [Bacteroidales bacterium]
MENFLFAIPTVLNQISKVLSDMCGQSITLFPTGKQCINENGKCSIEIKEISIPNTAISQPNPSCPQDTDGFYKVNRIRLGTTIFGDTAKGCPFSDEEIQSVIKGSDTWAYYEPIK